MIYAVYVHKDRYDDVTTVEAETYADALTDAQQQFDIWLDNHNPYIP